MKTGMFQDTSGGIQDSKKGRVRGQHLIRGDYTVYAIATGEGSCNLYDLGIDWVVSSDMAELHGV